MYLVLVSFVCMHGDKAIVYSYIICKFILYDLFIVLSFKKKYALLSPHRHHRCCTHSSHVLWIGYYVYFCAYLVVREFLYACNFLQFHTLPKKSVFKQ